MTKRILQLASFAGNQGDNANAAGTRALFQATFAEPLVFDNLEIRNYFRGRQKFDDAFVDRCNAYDLVVIGGGNYFELWVEDSCSGTTIDIDVKRLARIKPPILFHALGFDDGMGAPPTAVARARAWFAWLAVHPHKARVTLRNDGAMATALRVLGPALSKSFVGMPDCGFFMPRPPATGLPPARGVRIGINVAGDMPERRFAGFADGADGFVGEMVGALASLCEAHPEMELTFFPHIHKDLRLVAMMLERLPDPVVRSRVRVAPFVTGPGTEDTFFAHYAECDLVLGNRFHANVVPLGLAIPTLGLCNYPQIERFYGELGAEASMLDVSRPGFGVALLAAVQARLADLASERVRVAGVRERMWQSARATMNDTAAWLGWQTKQPKASHDV